MPYITTMQSPRIEQISLDDILNGEVDVTKYVHPNESNTRTVYKDFIQADSSKIIAMINVLKAFNIKYDSLFSDDMKKYYHTFHIPKHSGGLRRIDAPKDELMDALRCLKTIFENTLHVMYHTAAFAYVKKRSTVDAVKRHQANKSRWFAKFDFSNFFGSTTPEFLINILSQIYPFSEIVSYSDGENALRKALSLCFLNGGLPQGTPISPLLTNVMMIPIDYTITKRLKEKGSFVYTRYADDIIISSRRDFDCGEIQNMLIGILNEFDAPFKLNEKKTRYGSNAGRNWNLGIMLNKDNRMTIGYRKNRQFKAMVNNYLNDRRSNVRWQVHDVQVLSGLISYYKMIEREYVDYVISEYEKKYSKNLYEAIKEDLYSV